MRLLRIIAIAMPQLLVLLMAGGYLDLLGGWNHTDAAGITLLFLALAAPVVALLWLVAEAIRRSLRRRQGESTGPIWPAVLILAEALALDLLILSMARMH
ncbi:MAG: hypothetical protein AMJ58_02495 [Gammaproteobacteria bacterium SG8_30]|jgi:hypothetical protein|nr:MAG: hypothetical protein AMJ58_02495 [Gammaproteobacteria bacterium SG8_30]